GRSSPGPGVPAPGARGPAQPDVAGVHDTADRRRPGLGRGRDAGDLRPGLAAPGPGVRDGARLGARLAPAGRSQPRHGRLPGGAVPTVRGGVRRRAGTAGRRLHRPRGDLDRPGPGAGDAARRAPRRPGGDVPERPHRGAGGGQTGRPGRDGEEPGVLRAAPAARDRGPRRSGAL
ncbi:MAG: hypothetical protein AVDCRST_MAG41-920, partial [uncultured Corynebacteriales bacterium]